MAEEVPVKPVVSAGGVKFVQPPPPGHVEYAVEWEYPHEWWGANCPMSVKQCNNNINIIVIICYETLTIKNNTYT